MIIPMNSYHKFITAINDIEIEITIRDEDLISVAGEIRPKPIDIDKDLDLSGLIQNISKPDITDEYSYNHIIKHVKSIAKEYNNFDGVFIRYVRFTDISEKIHDISNQ